jgi:hypothetical protein
MDSLVYIVGWAAVPFLLLALLALIKRPGWTPAMLLATATATPWSFSKGVTPVLVLTVVLAALKIIDSVTKRSRRVILPATPRRAAAAFIGIAVVSGAWGYLSMEPAVEAFWTPQFLLVQLGQLATLVLAPVALLLTSFVLTSRTFLRQAVIGFLAVTTIGLVLSLVTSAVEINLRGLVLTWSACIIYGQLLFNDTLTRPIKNLLIGVLALTLFVKFGLAFTWVSGWLPTLVALGVVTAFRSRKAVIGIAAIGVVALVVFSAFFQQDYDREYNESGGSRLAKWTLVAKQPFVREHFVLGTGPATYAIYFSAYTPEDRLSTHNNYADIFLQMGVAGIGIVLWILVSAGRLGVKLAASGIKDPFLNGFVHSMVGGIVAVAVAMMLGDWFTPFAYNQTVAGFAWTVQSWIFIGALCAVPTMLRGETAPVARLRSRRTSSQPFLVAHPSGLRGAQ